MLHHDLMASIREKAIAILAGNLNSGRRYLITALHEEFHIDKVGGLTSLKCH